VGLVWTEDGGDAPDHGGECGGDGSMDCGDNVCAESSDRRLEDGGSSMGSGIVAYKERVWQLLVRSGWAIS
jgi:hypothetical protein